MADSILIKNGTIISSTETFAADILLENGKILEIRENIPSSADQIIDANGLHILPGVIDPQVHFRDPGLTHKEDLQTGSYAAAAGGVTGFLEMPNTNPATITASLMAEKKKIASEKSIVNYNFFIGATEDNIDEQNSVENVPGIKIFMGSSTGDLLVSDRGALDKIFANGTRLIAVHSENDEIINANQKIYAASGNFDDHRKIRSVDAALTSTQFAVHLSEKYSRRLHVLHLTTIEEAEFLAAQINNPLISAEVTPQHLTLAAPEIYDRLGAYAQMNPPIRSSRHREGLWKALRAGVINCIATDHAPHTDEEKSAPFGSAPSGMPGVETSLAVLLNEASKNMCSVNEVCKWMCESPAILYKMPGKGFIKKGFDADLAIVDLKKSKIVDKSQLKSKCGWNPYEGTKLTGWNVMTICGGNIVFRDGEIIDTVKGTEIKFSR